MSNRENGRVQGRRWESRARGRTDKSKSDKLRGDNLGKGWGGDIRNPAARSAGEGNEATSLKDYKESKKLETTTRARYYERKTTTREVRKGDERRIGLKQGEKEKLSRE